MASRKTKAGSTNSPDKKLPLNKSIPLGIQHVLAMFAGNITVPIIVAGVFGQTPQQKIFLIQMALFVAGVATIIQTVGYKEIGARLPIVQGTSFAFIPIMLPFKAAGLGAVFTAAFIGGIFQIFIEYVIILKMKLSMKVHRNLRVSPRILSMPFASRVGARTFVSTG